MKHPFLLAFSLLIPLACSKESRDKPLQSENSPAASSLSSEFAAPIRLPLSPGEIHLDGKLDEPGWSQSFQTQVFLGSPETEITRPHTEARLLVDRDFLYLAVFAADEDIRAAVKLHDGPVWTDDSVSIRLRPLGARDQDDVFAIDISASGVITDVTTGPDGRATRAAWESGTRVAVDLDGTANDSKSDEEWVVEAAIPIDSFCPNRRCSKVEVKLSRCDVSAAEQRRCVRWSGEHVIDLSAKD